MASLWLAETLGLSQAVEQQHDAETLAALHAKFRADLDAAPLDELKEAARAASRANVATEAAGGWRLTAALAMMRRTETREDGKRGGWAPFTDADVPPQKLRPTWASYEDNEEPAQHVSNDGWGDTRIFDDGIPGSTWAVSAAAEDDESAGSREVTVRFLDGTCLEQSVPSGCVAFDVLRRTAARLGVEGRDAGALALFSGGNDRLGRLVAPSEPVEGEVVLAVRLFTAPIHAAALRGAESPSATRGEKAISKLLYAQTVAMAMQGGFAVLPRLDYEAPPDDPKDTDEVDEAWRDAFPASDDRSAPTRLRLGALRLWSRAALGPSVNVLEAGVRLVARHGASTFCPPPAATDEELIAEFHEVMDGADLEIETTQGSAEASNSGATTPEARYLELAARSPAYGATLFACTRARRVAAEDSGVQQAPGALRWLAVSRRGASILSADASARLHDVPLDCARRWSAASSETLRFEYERPPNRWPRHASPRFQHLELYEESFMSGLASYFTSKKEKKPEERPSIECDAFGRVDSHLRHAPVMRVRFELDVDSSRAAAGGVAEAISLLDDYCLCDLAERPPVFGWNESNEPEKKPRAMPGFYDALVAAVVRPPRFSYDTRLMGPSSFRFGGRRFYRHDVVLANRSGERLHVSRWTLSPDLKSDVDRAPCVVFVHANSASRAQCCHYLSLVLSLGCSLVAFDCAGSGMSDGALVTLGWREANDLRVVLEWVHSLPDVSSIAVWGQSMGAAAALYYQGLAASATTEDDDDDPRDRVAEVSTWPKLDAIVLDSPYNDFQQLATHIAHERRAFFGGFTLPSMILDLLLSSLDASVNNKAGFSPLAVLSPLAHAPKCTAPALFVRARRDPLISQAHVESLAKVYAGPRTLALVEGTHSSPRDIDARKFIGKFLEKHLPLPPEHKRPPPRAVERHLGAAPWQRPRAKK